jgi:hypothetical protein
MKKQLFSFITLIVLGIGLTGCAPDRINDNTERVFQVVQGKPYMLPAPSKCSKPSPKNGGELICMTNDTYNKYSKFNDNGAKFFIDFNELEKQELVIKVKPMSYGY